MNKAICLLSALALSAQITAAEDAVFGRQLAQCGLTSNNNSCDNSYECASGCCSTGGFCAASNSGTCDSRTSCPDEKNELSGGAIAGIVIACVFCWCPALTIVALVLLTVFSPCICAALVICSPCIAVALLMGTGVAVAGCLTATATCILYTIYSLDIIGVVKRYMAARKGVSRVEEL